MNSDNSLRRVCVVTGSRAEYGILRPLLLALREASDLTLQLCVTGAHLDPAFGETWHQIDADGFAIDEKVALELGGDSGVATAVALGAGTAGFSLALSRLAPDLVVILGDRYEILAVASAALLLRVRVLHIHGGEKTEGAIDESIRHAVTKLCAIHCVATEEFARRVRQLGEQPECVHTVGTLALDAIASATLLDRNELQKELGFELKPPVLVVTYHPETAARPGSSVAPLLEALGRLLDTRIIITMPNADPGHLALRSDLQNWADDRPDRARAFASLGSVRYWSVLENAQAVVGNSSSGLIEAPFFGIPTINIGTRQQGRPRAQSVLDSPMDADCIVAMIERAQLPEMKAIAARRQSPYGMPGAAERIVEIIRGADLDGLRIKKFRDLNFDD